MLNVRRTSPHFHQWDLKFLFECVQTVIHPLQLNSELFFMFAVQHSGTSIFFLVGGGVCIIEKYV